MLPTPAPSAAVLRRLNPRDRRRILDRLRALDQIAALVRERPFSGRWVA